MATEIEHKYLVKQELWKKVVPEKSVEITQAYLHSDNLKTVRVRTAGPKGFLTVKGKTVGYSRLEFEYEIPLTDAKELIKKLTTNIIEKTRHYVVYENKTWEVDEFKGANKGLFVAEIELKAEDESYLKPEWVGENVSDNKKYSNSNLSVKPYTSW
jgi:adenylate cyclase